jgi:hypothetical protein
MQEAPKQKATERERENPSDQKFQESCQFNQDPSTENGHEAKICIGQKFYHDEIFSSLNPFFFKSVLVKN